MSEIPDIYRSTLEALPDGVVVQDAAGVIIEVNAAAERILGLTADQMTGRTSIDPNWRAVHPDGSDWPGDTHPVTVSLRTGDPVHNAVMGVHRPDGRLSWILINSVLVGTLGSETSRGVATFADITSLTEAQRDLAESNRDLRRFSSAATHEMQAPLRRIINYAELILEEVDEGSDGAEIARLLSENALVMRDVVSAVLAYSRIDPPRRSGQVAMITILERVREALEPQRHAVGANLQINCPDDVTADVDAELVAQALTAVIGNAFAHRDRSRSCIVRVVASLTDSRIEVVVADNGKGIPPQFQSQIFDMFQKLEKSPGMGMGLPIANRIAERHNGRLTVSSDGASGSVFTLSLPRVAEVGSL
ncbi:MAG: PAS domain-containing sensor histidine kinase [Actinobacteria bacterium]|nr:PAS domain-containing sensor histidine kinase [Actinomycetota bacterium]